MPVSRLAPLARGALAATLALLLGTTAVDLAAADAGEKAIQEFQAAMAGNDATAKKAAIRALADKSVGKDADILPLLVTAISDRQVGENAVNALGSRTGLPTPRGGVPKPGQDPAQLQQVWQGWLAQLQAKQKLKDLEKDKAEREKAAKDKAAKDKAAKDKKPDAEAKPETEKPTTPETEKAAPPAPAEDLGKPDRIIFKSGGSLICYIQSRRVDGDGNLLSLRVVHLDGGGEETLAADLIARVEEDIR